MGVRNLWDLLAPCGRRTSVDALGRKRLAVDASIWLIQFVKAMRDDRGEMIKNAPLLGLFRRLTKLLYLRVRPILVFDGVTPALKRRTVARRRAFRQKQEGSLRRTAEKILLNQMKGRQLLHGIEGANAAAAAAAAAPRVGPPPAALPPRPGAGAPAAPARYDESDQFGDHDAAMTALQQGSQHTSQPPTDADGAAVGASSHTVRRPTAAWTDAHVGAAWVEGEGRGANDAPFENVAGTRTTRPPRGGVGSGVGSGGGGGGSGGSVGRCVCLKQSLRVLCTGKPLCEWGELLGERAVPALGTEIPLGADLLRWHGMQVWVRREGGRWSADEWGGVGLRWGRSGDGMREGRGRGDDGVRPSEARHWMTRH